MNWTRYSNMTDKELIREFGCSDDPIIQELVERLELLIEQSQSNNFKALQKKYKTLKAERDELAGEIEEFEEERYKLEKSYTHSCGGQVMLSHRAIS